jgi:hypothetical protein
MNRSLRNHRMRSKNDQGVADIERMLKLSPDHSK